MFKNEFDRAVTEAMGEVHGTGDENPEYVAQVGEHETRTGITGVTKDESGAIVIHVDPAE